MVWELSKQREHPRLLQISPAVMGTCRRRAVVPARCSIRVWHDSSRTVCHYWLSVSCEAIMWGLKFIRFQLLGASMHNGIGRNFSSEV